MATEPAAAGRRDGSECGSDRPGAVSGPLTRTAAALTEGEISPAHARVLADGSHDLPDQVAAEAEPVLLEVASKLDPPRLRQAVGYLLAVADPDGADAARQRRHERRGLWLSPTLDNMVAVDGLLEAEAGQTVLAALEPLAPTAPTTPAVGASGPPTPWPSWPAAVLRGGGCPRLVGSDPNCWSPWISRRSWAPVVWVGRQGRVGGTAGPGGVPAAGL